MDNLENKLAYSLAIKDYLDQLSELSGHCVIAEQLGTLVEAERVKQGAAHLAKTKKKVIEIPPVELPQARFRAFVQRLCEANPSRVYVWLNATNSCGAIKLPNICDFNFAFEFSNFPEGVIVLLTEDLQDKLLLDFTTESVEIELQGVVWPDAEYITV